MSNQDEVIQVKLSGSAVYNAVKNYLKDNTSLKAQILAQVNELVTNGTLKNNALAQIKITIESYWFKKEILQLVKEEVKTHVRGLIAEEVKKALGEKLSNAIVVVPNDT